MSNAQTLRRIFDLMDQKQWDAIRELVTTDCVAIMGGQPAMDVDHWLGMGAMFYEAFPDGRHRIEEILDAGPDRVVLRGVFEGTHQHPFMGIPATGKRVQVTFLNLDRFKGDKLAEHRSQTDMMALLQQLGVVPA